MGKESGWLALVEDKGEDYESRFNRSNKDEHRRDTQVYRQIEVLIGMQRGMNTNSRWPGSQPGCCKLKFDTGQPCTPVQLLCKRGTDDDGDFNQQTAICVTSETIYLKETGSRRGCSHFIQGVGESFVVSACCFGEGHRSFRAGRVLTTKRTSSKFSLSLHRHFGAKTLSVIIFHNAKSM